MTALHGALATVAVGFAVVVCTDREAREAALTVLWSIAVGPFFLLVIGLVALGRLLPGGRWPLINPPRPLSPEALRRMSYRLGSEGWSITWRKGGILLIRKGKGADK